MKRIFAVLTICIMLLSAVAYASEFVDMPDDWSTAAIENAVKNGLMTGSDGHVYPNNNMTRAEMATIMVRACGATNDADISAFTDVTSADWFYDSMSRAVAMGAFNGSDNKLNPNNNITRQEAFVVLSRVFGLDTNEKIDVSVIDTFKDGNQVADWARSGVAAIISKGYVGGADGYLNPTANITRAEFAVVMDRLVKYYIDDPEITILPSDGNVMIRVGGLKIESAVTDKMVVIGDGVGTSEMSMVNAEMTDAFVVRGGTKVMIDGKFDSIKIIMPKITVEGNPAGIKKVHVCKDSVYSMGNIVLDIKPVAE